MYLAIRRDWRRNIAESERDHFCCFCVFNLGGKKNGGFLKQILSTSIQEKHMKIGDG